MTMSRRKILTGGAASAGMLHSSVKTLSTPRKGLTYKATAFDAFAIFDSRPVDRLCEILFPGQGEAFIKMWRAHQFEYAWLQVLMRRYADFERVTAQSLSFAANALKLDLADNQKKQLLQAYSCMPAWPDAVPSLQKLRQTGVRTAILSNLTPQMLQSCLSANPGLRDLFDHVLSTDAARTYKPDPRAYALAPDALKLPRENIAFIAYAGWDAVGAKCFGYPTFWANRAGAPSETLGDKADAMGADLSGLTAFIG
ncbi:haloacid dehalogenase type II [Methylovirgula sp. 4M-Z18]|uniref:haloacid dehalogenase type II n=1 Tax=Methylovirgula sp. 4M-Z18 TaxID=2293567 RepID=UPI000E2F1E8E|nr:haloacid dehalogenase type II [Methylovirgula sp. 4M-Z18]RFB77992.1 haloacid dehalogenase type II [Methylovirgula sp. 4M-Z18]